MRKQAKNKNVLWKVGVFPDDLAYVRDFHPDWPGCCLHTVIATSGTEAKKKALAEHRGVHIKQKVCPVCGWTKIKCDCNESDKVLY